ncbi:GPI transamidase component PIG-S [Venturia canescens]|uniref:GPI transamidase component PIG-S n=1 Tax=Venturia canescens TaxID=32260 RepID=UPI001C9C3F8A|nr:GPI transamidase component PIG-S [Venturia canescens]XP_043285714.1 GPI transamidase component PIG-S [Venturia canescens]
MTEETEVTGIDSPTDAKYRVHASIAFAVLLLGVGVPLWWHTTAVPRVRLPYAGIAELSGLEMKIKVNVVVAGLEKDRIELLAEEISQAFQDSEAYSLNVKYELISLKLVWSAYTPVDHEKIAKTFDLGVGDLLLLESPNVQGVLVGPGRSIFFSNGTSGAKLAEVLRKWILRDESVALTKNALTDPTKYSLDEENRRRFPASPAYDILLTLVNPEPEKLTVKWDLPSLANDYIEPFLQDISIVANFSIKSQWLYLMPLDVSPKQIPDSSPRGRHYALPEDVLPQLITPLEKKLASQISLHPCINLVVYVVPCDESPLHIYTKSGYRPKSINNVEAFLSPRWGGIVIANPPSEDCEEAQGDGAVEVVPNAATIMGVFIAQLRSLLGIPETEENISGVEVLPLVGSKPRDWELDALLRIRTVEQLTSAKLTLQSLAQLLEEISNIVITETVGNRINNALRLVESSAESLRRADLNGAFLLSKEAFVIAEEAFTDPSLLALLYFPDDQKYAVYIPLFLPVMIPVLLSLKNIKKFYFPSRAEEVEEPSEKPNEQNDCEDDGDDDYEDEDEKAD